MFKQILLIAFAIAGASANLNFHNCGSASNILSVTIRGCTSVPCTFQRGGSYYGEIVVTKAVNTPTLPTQVLIVPGFPLPAIPIFNGDMCPEMIQGSCPTQSGNTYVIRIEINVPSLVPPADGIVVRIVTRDAIGGAQMCIQFGVIVN